MGGVVYPFLYPPTTLPWFYPFSLFDFTTAIVLFQAVSIACLFIVILLLWREIVPRVESPAWQLIFVGALFVFAGVSATLNWAQINLIVLAFIALAWLRPDDPQADRRMGFCLFAATVLKTYPVLFLLVPLMRRRFGAIGWFAAFASADLLLSLVLLPTNVWRDWLVHIAPTGGYGEMPFGLFSASTAGNQNLNGLFLRLFGEGEPARVYATAAAASCVAVTALALFFARRLDDESYYGLSFGLISVLTFLIAPLSWPHHFVFVLPGLAWATVQASRLHASAARSAVKLVLLAALVICAYPWPTEQLAGLANPWLRSVPFAGPVLLFVLLLGLTAASIRRRAPSQAGSTARMSNRLSSALRPASPVRRVEPTNS